MPTFVRSAAMCALSRSGFPHDLRRAISRHRRVLAAAFAAASVAVALRVVAPPPPDTITVLAAARDLAGGSTLRTDDLEPVTFPAELVPAGAVRAHDRPRGHVLAAPMRAGEPLTNARLLGPDLASAYGDDLVAAPVRIADPGSVQLLKVGDRVDVLAVPTAFEPASATTPEATSDPAFAVAEAAPVIAIPEPDATGSFDGALVVLAVSSEVAAELARWQVSARLSVIGATKH